MATSPTATSHANRVRGRRRAARLRELGYSGYSEYLRSPAWRVVKARYRASEHPQVCMCGEAKVQLHHVTYKRVGEERLEDLTPLCARCHAMIHVLERRGDIGLDFSGLESPQRAAIYRIAQSRRRSGARAEFVDQEARNRREELTPGQRLDKAVERARVERIDVRSRLRLVDKVIGDIERKIDERRDSQADKAA